MTAASASMRITLNSRATRLLLFFLLQALWSFTPLAYAAQTCTVASTIKSVPAPTSARQMIYSPTYGRLIVRNTGSAVAVIDLATNQSTLRLANATFTDMAISPSGRYVFVADYGGAGYDYSAQIPLNPNYVHRLDLATNTWEIRTAFIAGGIQVVSDDQFILKSNDQWVTFTYNAWGTGSSTIILNPPGGFPWGAGYYASVYSGDFRYDPNTGRLLHGNSGSSSNEIQAFRFVGNNFVNLEGSGIYGSAQGYGGSVALATNGSAFYYGRLQVDPLDVTFNRRVFADPIYAATGNVAFGNGKLFDAQSGDLLGVVGFDTTIYALNRDGQDFWAFDATQNSLRHMSFTTAACPSLPAPIGVNATVPSGTTNIVVAWTRFTGAAGYNIYMARQSGVTKANYLSLGGQKRSNVSSPYTEFNVTPGYYFFVVTTYNDLGESVDSAEVSAWIPDTQAPTVPTGLTATVVSSSRINLSWSASTDNVGVSYYQIYRGGSLLWTVYAPQVSFADTGLSPLTSYSYTVIACDASGINCSAHSTPASATTPVNITPVPFSFAARSGVSRNSTVVSNSIAVSGVGVPVPISITGGEYSINGGAFTASPGTVTNGENVTVRLTSSVSYATTTTATLTVGDFSAPFNVTTAAPTINASQYYPLNLGNSWVTSKGGTAPAATTITDNLVVNGLLTTSLFDASDGSTTYISNDTQGLRLHRTVFAPDFLEGCGTFVETDTYSPPVTILPANATLGQTVSSSGTIAVDGQACGSFALSYFATSTFQGIERVSVPAGDFDAARVQVPVSISGLGTQNITYWFAAGIGTVKSTNSANVVEELVSTNIARTTPDEFIFTPQSNVPLSSAVLSNAVTISGITTAAPVSITGGEYSINGGAFTNQPGTITNGQSIRIRVTSSAQSGTTTSATLTVSGVGAAFSVTTGIDVPAAPVIVRITSGISSVTLTFNSPVNNGGAAITGYTAVCTSSNGGVTGTKTVGAGATSIQVGNLTNGKRYACTVAATNAAGTGSSSASSTDITPIDLTPILNLLLDDAS